MLISNLANNTILVELLENTGDRDFYSRVSAMEMWRLCTGLPHSYSAYMTVPFISNKIFDFIRNPTAEGLARKS